MNLLSSFFHWFNSSNLFKIVVVLSLVLLRAFKILLSEFTWFWIINNRWWVISCSIKLASVTLSKEGCQGQDSTGDVVTLVKFLVPLDHQAYPMNPNTPRYKGLNT